MYKDYEDFKINSLKGTRGILYWQDDAGLKKFYEPTLNKLIEAEWPTHIAPSLFLKLTVPSKAKALASLYGYEPCMNPGAKDGRWKVKGKATRVYMRKLRPGERSNFRADKVAFLEHEA
jgi:hypothetical protein